MRWRRWNAADARACPGGSAQLRRTPRWADVTHEGSGEERTFFRIVRSNPPTILDFTSNAAQGRRIRAGLPRMYHRLWDGLSAYDRADAAHAKAMVSPMLGRYVAELRVPPGSPIRIEQTTGEASHHTLWGDPSDLLGCVVDVRAVDQRATKGR
jgi:hypothetical protein